MKEFFKSYNEEVLVPALKWSKKHWKGMVVLTVVTYTIEIGIIYRNEIADKIEKVSDSVKEKFHKG